LPSAPTTTRPPGAHASPSCRGCAHRRRRGSCSSSTTAARTAQRISRPPHVARWLAGAGGARGEARGSRTPEPGHPGCRGRVPPLHRRRRDARPDWLCAYERLIRSRDPDAFGSRIEVAFEDARPAWLTDELLGFLGELNGRMPSSPLTEPGTSFHGGNFGFRQTVVDTVGEFDSDLGRKGTEQHRRGGGRLLPTVPGRGTKVWWTPRPSSTTASRRPSEPALLPRPPLPPRADGGIRRRGTGSRVPPGYLYGQLLRATSAVWPRLPCRGRNATLRREMNVAYFTGHILALAVGRVGCLAMPALAGCAIQRSDPRNAVANADIATPRRRC